MIAPSALGLPCAAMLVAIHGFTENDLSWQEVLGGTGVELSTPLLPGHGWNPCPPDTTIASTAADLAARYDEPFDLIGYSMGGRIALRLAIDHPELVRRLILVSVRPGTTDAEARAERIARDEGLAEILEEDGIGTFVAWWENHPVLRPVKPLPTVEEEALRCTRLNQDPLGLAAALRCFSQGRMEPLNDRLDAITARTLIIGGEADTAFAEDLRILDDGIPNAELCMVPECGHAVHREAPDALRAALLRFLID